ncbi:MAG: HupE/UreJ family protein [Rubrivivax sp.]
MTPFPLPRAIALATLALAAGTAAAHTGHGHDGFDLLHGLWHALTEPDHLALLIAGGAFASAAAPLVLRGLRVLRRRLLQRRLPSTRRG